MDHSVHNITLIAHSMGCRLLASKKFNGAPRLGDSSKGIVVISNMDSIDASVTGDDILRHSYVGEPTLLNELHALMTSTAPPSKRLGLMGIGAPPMHWKLKP